MVTIASLVRHPGRLVGHASLDAYRGGYVGTAIPVAPLDVTFTTTPGALYMMDVTLDALFHGQYPREWEIVCDGEQVAHTVLKMLSGGWDGLLGFPVRLSGLWAETQAAPRSVTMRVQSAQVTGDSDWRLQSGIHTSAVTELYG